MFWFIMLCFVTVVFSLANAAQNQNTPSGSKKPTKPPDPVAPKPVLPETFVPMTTNDSDRMYEEQKAKMMEGVDVPPEIARREAARAHWNEVYKAGKK